MLLFVLWAKMSPLVIDMDTKDSKLWRPQTIRCSAKPLHLRHRPGDCLSKFELNLGPQDHKSHPVPTADPHQVSRLGKATFNTPSKHGDQEPPPPPPPHTLNESRGRQPLICVHSFRSLELVHSLPNTWHRCLTFICSMYSQASSDDMPASCSKIAWTEGQNLWVSITGAWTKTDRKTYPTTHVHTHTHRERKK